MPAFAASGDIGTSKSSAAELSAADPTRSGQIPPTTLRCSSTNSPRPFVDRFLIQIDELAHPRPECRFASGVMTRSVYTQLGAARSKDCPGNRRMRRMTGTSKYPDRCLRPRVALELIGENVAAPHTGRPGNFCQEPLPLIYRNMRRREPRKRGITAICHGQLQQKRDANNTGRC
jgi:hypothetical protein